MTISERPPKERRNLVIHGLNKLVEPRRSVPPSEDPKGEHDCVFQPEETKLPEDPQIPALDKNGLPLGDGDGGLVFIHPPIKGRSPTSGET